MINVNNNEAQRLVYADGIDLTNALTLSNEYQNIIFITNDHSVAKTDERVFSDETGYVDNESWPLGINIVKNGLQYIPIVGIHPEMNSIYADGYKYVLKVQKNTGLLCLTESKIKLRCIYIGTDLTFLDIHFHLDDIEKYPFIYEKQFKIYSKDNGQECGKILLTGNIMGSTFNVTGYLVIFEDIDDLKNSTFGPLSLMNYDFENSNVLSSATKHYIELENKPYNESLFYNTNNVNPKPIYVIIPMEFRENVQITNTLTAKSNSNAPGIHNDSLISPFLLNKLLYDDDPVKIDTFNYQIFQVANNADNFITYKAIGLKII